MFSLSAIVFIKPPRDSDEIKSVYPPVRRDFTVKAISASKALLFILKRCHSVVPFELHNHRGHIGKAALCGGIGHGTVFREHTRHIFKSELSYILRGRHIQVLYKPSLKRADAHMHLGGKVGNRDFLCKALLDALQNGGYLALPLCLFLTRSLCPLENTEHFQVGAVFLNRAHLSPKEALANLR